VSGCCLVCLLPAGCGCSCTNQSVVSAAFYRCIACCGL
jgi:hypothetical protein